MSGNPITSLAEVVDYQAIKGLRIGAEVTIFPASGVLVDASLSGEVLDIVWNTDNAEILAITIRLIGQWTHSPTGKGRTITPLVIPWRNIAAISVHSQIIKERESKDDSD
jgi:sporulation protein YlmC with PRC-barrel domain